MQLQCQNFDFELISRHNIEKLLTNVFWGKSKRPVGLNGFRTVVKEIRSIKARNYSTNRNNMYENPLLYARLSQQVAYCSKFFEVMLNIFEFSRFKGIVKSWLVYISFHESSNHVSLILKILMRENQIFAKKCVIVITVIISLYYKETNYTVLFTFPLQEGSWKVRLVEFKSDKKTPDTDIFHAFFTDISMIFSIMQQLHNFE